MRIVFDSNDLPGHLAPTQKAGAWAESMEQCGVNFEATSSRKGFSAKLTAALLDDVLVSWASATSIRVVRTASRIARDNDDRIELLIGVGNGNLYVRQAGREAECEVGAGVFFDHASPNRSGAANGGDAIAVMLPRRRLGRAVPVIENRFCRLVPDCDAMRLLRGYADFVLRQETTDPALTELMASHLCDLAVLASGARGLELDQARERGLPAARLRTVLDAIAKRCREPGLTVADVAASLGISPRYVQHLLHADNRTFTAELTNRRLELAHARLSDPAAHGRSVLELALSCGFSDLSTFYRTFRTRYGCTPSELRAHRGSDVGS